MLKPDGTLDAQAFMLQGILGDPHIQAITNGHPELYDKITYEDAVKWRKEWMDARAADIQHKIDNSLYTASLTKQGPGTLILTGDNTYEGGTTVEGGKLSITGSQAGSIDVKGGTLGGSGSVAGSIDVDSGVLQPGLTSEEAAALFTDDPGNVLHAGGNVRLGGASRLVVPVRSANDYGKLRADGDLVLGGELVLDLQEDLKPGAALTIATGRSLTGTFAGLPEGSFLRLDGHVFRVSYLNNRVTLTLVAELTVGGTVPPMLALTLGAPASFGAFTPGVAREYSASTTANVISTAGNATAVRRGPERHGDRQARQRRVLAAAGAAGQRWRRVPARRRRGGPDHVEDLVGAGLQRRGDDRVPAGDRRRRRAAHRHLLEDADLHALDDGAVMARTP